LFQSISALVAEFEFQSFWALLARFCGGGGWAIAIKKYPKISAVAV
jgi:hypothetical protein